MKQDSNKKKQVSLRTGDYQIEITYRHCSENVQKEIVVGKRYKIVEKTTLTDGTPVVVVQHPNSKRKNATLRVNAHRFSWRLISYADVAQEERLQQAKARIKEAKNILETQFTEKEQRQILYVPGAILEMSIKYAEKARNLARGDKKQGLDPLSQYHKLSNELRIVFEGLDREKYYALGQRRQYLEDSIKAFMKEKKVSIMFQTFLNVIQMEYFRIVPDAPDRITHIRMYAACSYYLILMLLEQEKDIDNLITQKFGGCYPHVVSNNVEALCNVMSKYSEINKLGFTHNLNIENGVKALKNAINAVSFDFKQ